VTPKHIKLHTYFNALKQIIKELVSVNEEVYKEALTYILPMKNAKKKGKHPKKKPMYQVQIPPRPHYFFQKKSVHEEKKRLLCSHVFFCALCV